ncbi:MAG: N-acetylmuramoyl-L-alanine amidase [Bacteroidales bacterium]|nr:N-acetylmuramoyl-L-alanine amidase [Bacteroidales bacterium]
MKYKVLTLLFALVFLGVFTPLRADIKLKTVVIDAGHGGNDAGCVSADNKTYEKNITLTVAKTLADKIHARYPDVKVILTRSTDVFVPLNDRADIANKNNADLFISIHVNSVPKSSAKTANGFSLHVLGQSQTTNRDLYALNMDLCRRENSVITLEDNYQETYQGFDPKDPESFIFFSLLQNTNLEQSLIFADEATKTLAKGPISHSRGISQDPFLVLWRTTMPSALVEIGFMSNPSDLEKLRNAANLDKIAQNLCDAFGNFKAKYENTGKYTAPAQTPAAPAKETAKPATDAPKGSSSTGASSTATTGKVFYGTQIMAVAKNVPDNDPMFKGYKPTQVKSASSKLIKYIIGTSTDKAKAQSDYAKIKAKFPDSFFVKVEGETITRLK